MRTLITLTGKFNSKANLAHCLNCFGKLGIPRGDISTADNSLTHFRGRTSRVSSVDREDKLGSRFGLPGAIIGGVIGIIGSALSQPWGVLGELGLLGSLALGLVLGCMCGTLIGCLVGSIGSESFATAQEKRTATNKLAISVKLENESFKEQAVKAIMEEFGAVVIKTTGPSRASANRESPPLLPG